MKMTREIETCFNLQKIFTHTPTVQEMDDKQKKL